jgi:hypothetical protein
MGEAQGSHEPAALARAAHLYRPWPAGDDVPFMDHNPYKPPVAAIDVPAPGDPSMPVPPSVVLLMAQTRPWVKLLAVLFFVGLGFAATAMVWAASFMARGGSSSPVFSNVLPMMLLMLFYVPPALFLWRYAARIRRLQDGGGLPALEEALASQKSFWKYVGIMAAVMLCLYAIAFLGMGMFGATLRR